MHVLGPVLMFISRAVSTGPCISRGDQGQVTPKWTWMSCLWGDRFQSAGLQGKQRQPRSWREQKVERGFGRTWSCTNCEGKNLISQAEFLKYSRLYVDLLRAYKRKPLIASGSQQRTPEFCVRSIPLRAGKRQSHVFRCPHGRVVKISNVIQAYVC